MKTRLLSVLLALALLISVVPAISQSASAADNGFLFDAETGTITGYYDKTVTELVIPEKIGGVAVTAIGDIAFYRFINLARVTLPDSLTVIGNQAFAFCSSLKSVDIPESVTSIGFTAFDVCESMTAINVAKGNRAYSSVDGVLYTKDMKTLITCPDAKSGEISIPKGVIRICDSAFSNCSRLTSVTIPEGVTEIEYSTFIACSSLKSVTIPEGVTTIGSSAFDGCYSLKSVTIPKSVTMIVSFAFDDCESLTDVYYSGTEEEWNAVRIFEGNDRILNATKHFAEQEQKPQAITVIVDGKTVEWTDAAPFISNNRTLVPLRAVANALGLNVTWDGKARTAEFSGNATATDGKKYNVSVKFTIGSRRMAVKYSDSAKNETTDYIAIDSAPLIKNNRTYAPIRFLAEHFGYTVKWDKNTKTITITSGKISPPVFNFSGFANGTYDADMENATTVRKSDGSVETVLYLTRPVIIPDSVVKTLKVGSVINLGKYGGYGTLTLESFDRKSNYGHEWIELDEEHELYKLSNGDWILCDLFTGNEFKWIYKEIKVTVSKSVPVYDEYSYGPNSTKIRDLRDFFDRNSYVNFKSLGVTVTNGKISSIMIYFVPQA